MGVLIRVIYTCIRHCFDTLNIPLTYSLIDIETLCLELNQVLSLVIFQTCIKNGYWVYMYIIFGILSNIQWRSVSVYLLIDSITIVGIISIYIYLLYYKDRYTCITCIIDTLVNISTTSSYSSMACYVYVVCVSILSRRNNQVTSCTCMCT